MMYGDWSWWWMLPMMLFMALVVAGVMWAFVVAVTRTGGSTSPTRPEDILNERFARGEIDITEYTERVQALHRADPMTKR